MPLEGLQHLSKLTDSGLVNATVALVRQRRSQTALIVAHLAAIARRRAYRPLGYSSLYLFCVNALHLSEHSAHKHVWGVRFARRFPPVLDAIAEGRVLLAGVCELARHMTPQNAAELLEAATHRTRREIQLLLAERFPKADVPTVVVALPTQVAPQPAAGFDDAALANPSVTGESCKVAPGQLSANNWPVNQARVCSEPTPPARITPIAPARFAMQLTIGQHTHDLLQRAKELLAHARPGCDVAQVLEMALADFVAKLEKRKFGDTHAPKARRATSDTRYVPADVKRRVAKRDGKQCTFVSENGVRCDAREMLEFDHVTPFARGGRSVLENLRLRCRAHNQLTAEQAYGAGFMDMKRSHGLVRERVNLYDVSPTNSPASTAPWPTPRPLRCRVPGRDAAGARRVTLLAPRPRTTGSRAMRPARSSPPAHRRPRAA
jgi:hypothetical protein